MGNLLVLRRMEQHNGQLAVKIIIENHSDLIRAFKLHEVLKQEAVSVSPAAKITPLGDDYDHHWKISVGPGECTTLIYSIRPEGASFREPVVEGLEADIVTGARVI